MTNRILRLSSKYGYGSRIKRQFEYLKERFGKMRGVVKMLNYLDLAF